MPPKGFPYKPLYPDAVGARVRFITGTGNRYGVTRRGNIYRVYGATELRMEHFPPLKPERPNNRRDLARVRVRLDTDPPTKRLWHSVAWLVWREFRKNEYTDVTFQDWEIVNINGDPLDNRPRNLDIMSRVGVNPRERLNKPARAMARLVIRSRRWTVEQITRAFHVKRLRIRELVKKTLGDPDET